MSVTVKRCVIVPSKLSEKIIIPGGSKFLYCNFGPQGMEVIHMWFEVDDDFEPVERRFHVFPTDRALPGNVPLEYVGTAQDPSIRTAMHVYERK